MSDVATLGLGTTQSALPAILVLLVAAGGGWLGAWLVRRHALNLGLVQLPNHRSSHQVPTPTGGGIGIVIGVTAAGLLAGFMGLIAWRWPLTLALALPLAAVGFIDDRRPVPARLRLALQLLSCGLLLVASGAWQALGPIGFLVLLVAGVWWINLFNFMDGIDGLAASQAIFMTLGAVLLGLFASLGSASGPGGPVGVGGSSLSGLLPLASVAAGCGGFLCLNWPPARVFMGDVGSTWLGFMLFGFALESVVGGGGGLHPAVWLVLGATFGCDATVTLLRRMLRGERWTEAHRSHAYQRLARRFGAHRPVTLLVIAVNLGWLLPLALLVQIRPEWGWPVAALACLPILAGVLAAGAGRSS